KRSVKPFSSLKSPALLGVSGKTTPKPVKKTAAESLCMVRPRENGACSNQVDFRAFDEDLVLWNERCISEYRLQMAKVEIAGLDGVSVDRYRGVVVSHVFFAVRHVIAEVRAPDLVEAAKQPPK